MQNNPILVNIFLHSLVQNPLSREKEAVPLQHTGNKLTR